MVESKNKTAAARAKIAHKLARYARATPIHLSGISGSSQPSTSHLSISTFIQHSEELPKEDSETKLTLGIQPMNKSLITKEHPKKPEPQKEENPSPPEPSSSSSPESAEEEELLLLKLSHLETF